MLKAEQELLVQTTNQQLLGIRQAELDYFTSVYDTYAFQAALVAGSVANGFEQVLTQPAIIPRWLKSGYWISAAFSMAFSIHCLSCTSFLSIYGPGFAMRGPVGSMTKAVRGMIQEHHQVFVSYVLTIASFGVNILFCVWSIMYQKEAWVCSGLVLVAFYFWYKYCVRAYNRFGDWDTEHVEEGLAGGGAEENIIGEDGQVRRSRSVAAKSGYRYGHGPGRNPSNSNSMHNGEAPPEPPENPYAADVERDRDRAHRCSADVRISFPSEHDLRISADRAQSAPSSSLFSRIFGPERRPSVQWPAKAPLSSQGGHQQQQGFGEEEEEAEECLRFEGYMTLGDNPINGSWVRGYIDDISFKSWDRFYFVLRDNCLWCYKSKQHYHDNSKKPIKSRPIKMNHYRPLHVTPSGSGLNMSSDSSRNIPMVVLECIDREGRSEVQREASLRHNEHELKPWGLRTDTQDELEEWLVLLEKASTIVFDGRTSLHRPSASIGAD